MVDADKLSLGTAASYVGSDPAGLDVLVNIAGIGSPAKAAEDITAAGVAGIYETNVTGLVRVTHAFLPLLMAPGPRPESVR